MRLIAERVLRNSPMAAPSATSPPSLLNKSLEKAGDWTRPRARDEPSKLQLQAYGEDYVQMTYMQGEIADQNRWQPIQLAKHREGRCFHLYCSEHNLGAPAVGEELQALVPSLRCSSEPEQIAQCEQFLVYLTSATWTRGEASVAFAREVCVAMRAGVRLLCAHETPGARSGDTEAWHACAFGDLFEYTPGYLLRAPIYGAIAMNLSRGEWREAGLIMIARQVALGGGERSQFKLEPKEDEEEMAALLHGKHQAPPPPPPPPRAALSSTSRGAPSAATPPVPVPSKPRPRRLAPVLHVVRSSVGMGASRSRVAPSPTTPSTEASVAEREMSMEIQGPEATPQEAAGAPEAALPPSSGNADELVLQRFLTQLLFARMLRRQQSSQWDLRSSLRDSQGAQTSLVLAHEPLCDGFDGRGGLRVQLPALESMEEEEALERIQQAVSMYVWRRRHCASMR